MSNELVAQLSPQDFVRGTAVGYQPYAQTMLMGDLMVLRLNKMTTDPYNTIFQIPASLTMGTGLTFTFITIPSNEFPTDLGLAIVLGVTVKALVAGATDLMSAGTGTEQTVTITHQSTKDEVSVTSLAVANANLNSAVVGNVISVNIRRIGTNASDTAQGSAGLVYCGVKNT